jgi:hypothetical protein
LEEIEAAGGLCGRFLVICTGFILWGERPENFEREANMAFRMGINHYTQLMEDLKALGVVKDSGGNI